MKVQEKKKKVVVLCFCPRQNLNLVQRRQRNVQKSLMHAQSCCFASQTYCFFAVLIAVTVVVA